MPQKVPEYRFNIAILGPDDEINQKFVELVALKHGNVDGVHFHVGEVENLAILNYWQPHFDAESKKLVDLSYKTANAIILVLAKKNEKLEEEYRKIIYDYDKDLPVATFIMKSGPKAQTVAKELVRNLAVGLKLRAEALKLNQKKEEIEKKKRIEQRAGDPIYYVDDATGLVTTTRSKGATPLFFYAKEDEPESKDKKKSQKIQKKES